MLSVYLQTLNLTNDCKPTDRAINELNQFIGAITNCGWTFANNLLRRPKSIGADLMVT